MSTPINVTQFIIPTIVAPVTGGWMSLGDKCIVIPEVPSNRWDDFAQEVSDLYEKYFKLGEIRIRDANKFMSRDEVKKEVEEFLEQIGDIDGIIPPSSITNKNTDELFENDPFIDDDDD